MVLDIVAKHANNGDFFALNQISKINSLLGHNVSDHDVHFKMFQHNLKAKYAPNGVDTCKLCQGCSSCGRPSSASQCSVPQALVG